MEFKTLKFENKDGIGVLAISRPQAMNALNKELIEELQQFVEKAESLGLRALIITGEGKAFVAGADINEFKDMTANQAASLSEKGQKLLSRLESFTFPVIAAVNGFALGGGCELALACDFIIASEKAKLGLPEVSLGLIPGYGGTQRLSRNIGRALAKAITLSGDIFTAQQFYEWGLVVECTTAEELMPRSLHWAQSIAKRSPLAVASAKKAIQTGFDHSEDKAMKLEAELFANCFNTQDAKEGVSAFLEKRTAQFQGN
ncbi:MAG: enoyl-CoA hydratase/isomerase family protein [Bdellovibrionales bacterium]|nr:enoyl-CoA hydratase/isomerase family protein [Bdellovibrionales bacterium]